MNNSNMSEFVSFFFKGNNHLSVESPGKVKTIINKNIKTNTDYLLQRIHEILPELSNSLTIVFDGDKISVTDSGNIYTFIVTKNQDNIYLDK